jgi:Fic family protein
VADFMAYFQRRYRLEGLGRGARLVAMAAAHHRLNDIHPFADGNGRVSRLISHAMGLATGIGAHGLWSISRDLESRLEYKRMMDHADLPRQGDLDGRGNLSLGTLIEDGLLGSETPKGPASLRFPAQAVDILLPPLFPEA